MSDSRRWSLSARSRQNLTEAVKEEAFAFAQYKVLAKQARKRGHRKLSALLEKIAEQHYLKHFTAQTELLGFSANNDQELAQEAAEESFLVEIICKLFAREANQDGDTEVVRRLNKMRQDEMLRRMELGNALRSLNGQARDPGKRGGHR